MFVTYAPKVHIFKKGDVTYCGQRATWHRTAVAHAGHLCAACSQLFYRYGAPE